MAILLLTLLLTADPTTIEGRCVSVADGDTITILLADKTQLKVRLASIDAPEKGQPFGTKAREHLAGLVHEKDVRVITAGTDRYGRTLGVVWIGETNVNEDMIHAGFAWQYRQYDKTKAMADLQNAAKEARRGLWADPEPIAPWEWRKAKTSPTTRSDHR